MKREGENSMPMPITDAQRMKKTRIRCRADAIAFIFDQYREIPREKRGEARKVKSEIAFVREEMDPNPTCTLSGNIFTSKKGLGTIRRGYDSARSYVTP
jgi:hypothetical protein